MCRSVHDDLVWWSTGQLRHTQNVTQKSFPSCNSWHASATEPTLTMKLAKNSPYRRVSFCCDTWWMADSIYAMAKQVLLTNCCAIVITQSKNELKKLVLTMISVKKKHGKKERVCAEQWACFTGVAIIWVFCDLLRSYTTLLFHNMFLLFLKVNCWRGGGEEI